MFKGFNKEDSQKYKNLSRRLWQDLTQRADYPLPITRYSLLITVVLVVVQILTCNPELLFFVAKR